MERKNALIVGVMAKATTAITKNTQHVLSVTEVAEKHVTLVGEVAVLEAIGMTATLVGEPVQKEIVTTATETDIR